MVRVKLPNFLIVGAAKAGTTSLYYYLKQHPEVYMSPVKEPRFITAQFLKFPLRGIKDDKRENNIIKSFTEYKKLFENINNEKALGEASADNLYFYEDAIKYIKDYLGNIKIIIILRNPIERTFSSYQMLVKSIREYLPFEEALKAEDQRKNMNWAYAWHYKSVSLYYNQVRAYLENFKQVKVYLYDDLVNDTLGLIKDIFRFLEVDTSFVPDINTKHNVGGIPKNKFVFKIFFVKSRKYRKSIKKILKIFFPEEKVLKFLERLKSKSLEKQQMKPETREYLKNLFREDILKLQTIINRDLSHWL